MRSSVNFYKDSSNRKPATAYNPFMIGHVANELRHHKFSEDRIIVIMIIIIWSYVDVELPFVKENWKLFSHKIIAILFNNNISLWRDGNTNTTRFFLTL